MIKKIPTQNTIYKTSCVNFKGNFQKISTTPTMPKEKIVQFYGAASSIPTTLSTSYIDFLNENSTINEAIQNVIINERNNNTIDLLKKASPEKAKMIFMRMHDYALAKEISSVIAQEGYGILTGDATGAMEAAKIGAKQNDGYCIGIALKGEKLINEHLDEIYIENTWNKRIDRFNKTAKAPFSIVMPGGEGTISKLWGKMVDNIIEFRKDSKKGSPNTLILVDKKYWEPMIDWLKNKPSERGYIRAFNYDMLKIIDNADELKIIIKQIGQNMTKIKF